MKKALGKALAGALVAIGMVAGSSTANAVVCGSATADTLGEWAALGAAGCTEGDKLFKYIGGTLNDTKSAIEVSWLGGNLPNDIHQIFIGGGATPIYASGDANANFTLSYSIEVTDLTRFITTVDLDVTQSQQTGSTAVVKDVSDATPTLLGTLTSNNGAAVAPLATNDQLLNIFETFSKTGNAIMNSAQNTFTQNLVGVPEPATLALVGLGLMGLAARRRRKS